LLCKCYALKSGPATARTGAKEKRWLL
jgi:hypothetical protein